MERGRRTRLASISGLDSRVGVLACLAFGLMGWSRVLVPALIRPIEHDFDQTDVGMGAYYLLSALLYAVGSLTGGALAAHFGRRVVLAAAGLAIAAGLLVQGLASGWTLFVAAAIPSSLGAGALDVGLNALFLDIYWRRAGGALNMLHFSFSVAALGAPIGVAVLVGGGLSWQLMLLATAIAMVPIVILLARAAPVGRGRPDVDERAARETVRGPILPLAALALAIGCYVAAEAGISDWVVRFLAALPLGVAALGLALFWAGITVGRVVCARLADRLDPVRAAAAFAVAGAVLVLALLLVGVPEVQLVLFGLVGVAFGPVYPLTMAAGGTFFPGRSALVSGVLASAAVGGAIAYPPVVGVISVTIGLPAAMVGVAGLALASGAMLVVARRWARAGTASRTAGVGTG